LKSLVSLLLSIQVETREATLYSVAKYFVAFAVALYTLKQLRKPSRWGGRFFLWIMNMSHSSVTDWGLQHVHAEEDFTILDVGCGGGRTIEKLAALAGRGKVYGADYAKGSVAASAARNAGLIEAGRVEVKNASVSQLPFPENSFDLITAVETQYYWPDLTGDMKELLRVLKPGATLLVVAESYRNGRFDRLQRPVMKLLRSTNMSEDEQRQLFLTAGYRDVQVFKDPTRGWLCALGKK
jgi:ubiquinone/menaquinone biosynthesis C-methylase UbiE